MKEELAEVFEDEEEGKEVSAKTGENCDSILKWALSNGGELEDSDAHLVPQKKRFRCCFKQN